MKSIKAYSRSHPFFSITFAITLILLTLMVIMNYFFPREGANGYKSFIIAFEFAESPQEIRNLFEGLATEDIKNTDTGNYFDFAYMLCYSFLLAYMFGKSAKIFQKKWLLMGIPGAIIILAGDFFENIILLMITHSYLTENIVELPSLLNKLHVITWIKWGGLAFVFFIFYEVLVRQQWLYKILGIICLFPLLYIILGGSLSPKEITAFTYSVILSFFVVIVFGLTYKNMDLTENEQ